MPKNGNENGWKNYWPQVVYEPTSSHMYICGVFGKQSIEPVRLVVVLTCSVPFKKA